MRTDRLEQLAHHLLYGKRGHRVFDFNIINDNPNECGTVGCAMGEFPILWPDHWKFYDFEVIRKNIELGRGGVNRINQISDWFEFYNVENTISVENSPSISDLSGGGGHLFYPLQQDPMVFGGRLLDITATAEDVALNILSFIYRFAPAGYLFDREFEPRHLSIAKRRTHVPNKSRDLSGNGNDMTTE